MNQAAGNQNESSLIVTNELSGRERYQLLTSLVVPRPIGWVSSRSAGGLSNLAPFSYFGAVAATPMLLSITIGRRHGTPKDTLTNIRETGDFCINIVTRKHLAAMNESSGEHPPNVDEFEIAGVSAAAARLVAAPYVADCPAVFECRLRHQVELEEAAVVIVIGEAVAVHLGGDLRTEPETRLIDPESLEPVARLGGELYAFLGEIPRLSRPVLK